MITLISKDSATIIIPSAYTWKILPMAKRATIHKSTNLHRLIFPFSTFGIKNSGNGLNSNSCRFRLVVGCCEKIITNSTQPASPCISISNASHHLNLFFCFHSISAIPKDTTNRIHAHCIGVKGKSSSIT